MKIWNNSTRSSISAIYLIRSIIKISFLIFIILTIINYHSKITTMKEEDEIVDDQTSVSPDSPNKS